MNLAFLTTSYPRFDGDDAGIFVKRLVDALAKDAKKILVLAPLDKSEPSSESYNNIEVKRFRYKFSSKPGLAFGAGIIPNLTNRPWLIIQLPILGLSMLLSCISFQKKYDLLIANWIFAGLIAYFSKLVTKRPYIYIVRGAEVKMLNTFFGKVIFKTVIANAKHTICVSEDFCSQLKSNFPSFQSKISYIPNGITVSKPSDEQIKSFVNNKNINFQTKTLLFVGTIIPRKNIRWLIELMTKPELKEFQLLLCGRIDNTNYVAELKNLVATYNLESQVHFIGEVNPREVPLYIALSSAYITASTHEGTPNSILEALAMGKLIFASDILAHKNILTDGENGFLFDLSSQGKLASQIIALTSDENLVSKVEKNAQESVKERSWENCAKNYWQVLKS